jgi:internalin A
VKGGLLIAVVMVSTLSALRLGWAGDAKSLDAAATAEIEKLGGHVFHCEEQGDTFVEVSFQIVFTNDAVTDADLRHLNDLSRLRTLDIWDIKITGSGLSYLKNHGFLQGLDMHNTAANDAGMKYVGMFTELRRLYLCGTQITDAGLEPLKGLRHLEELNLSETQITGDGLEHLGGLTKLKKLNLSGTKLTDAALPHLARMTQLERLDLSRTAVTGSTLGKLNGLRHLKSLIFQDTLVTDSGLEHLKDQKQLEELALENTKVTDAGLKHLEGLSHLRTLWLSGPGITNQALKQVGQLSALWSVGLARTKITDDGLKHLKGLTLFSLRLSDTEISDAGLKHLKGLRDLWRLDVTGTNVTREGVEDLKKAFAHLEVQFVQKGRWVSKSDKARKHDICKANDGRGARRREANGLATLRWPAGTAKRETALTAQNANQNRKHCLGTDSRRAPFLVFQPPAQRFVTEALACPGSAQLDNRRCGEENAAE